MSLNCPRMMQSVPTLRLMLFAAVAFLTACTKDRPEPRVVTDSPAVAPMTKPTDSVATVVRERWNSADGTAIYIPGDVGVAQVILPPVLDDSVPKPGAVDMPGGAAPASVDLFSPSGRIGTIGLGDYSAAKQPAPVEGCDAWPVVPIRAAAGTAIQGWRIALKAGVAEPLHADSIGAVARKDSADLVVQINKAAALLPLDSAGVLARVPFGVTKAYRLRLPGDVDAIIAVVERRLNVEASPRVERTVLLLERPAGAKTYNAAWRDTQYAAEDDLIAVDLLGVVLMKDENRPTIFLGLDFGDGTRVQMLQRTGGKTWSLRWASAYTGC